MKNHSVTLFSVFLFLLPLCLIGQELADYAPKTPEAMAMDKFVDIPPGSYTGVAGYSIPLYNISVDGYNIPITLNYHGMGIKVNEVASSVGLGWSLNIGGISLSREVMGVNDNDINTEDLTVGDFFPNTPNHPDRDTARDMVNGLYELMPDYYSYSLLNNSGKFIIDNIGNAQTIPKDDIKVISSTLLIDNQGIEYHFGQQLESFSVTGTSAGSSLSASTIPSYRINQIVFPSGKTVDFSYVNSVHNYIANHTETKSVFNNYANLSLNDIVDGGCSLEKSSTSRAVYSMTEKLIQSITYDGGKIDFIYASTDREDIGGKKIEEIHVNGANGSSLQLIKNYDFTTSYWQGSTLDINIPSWDPLYDGLVKRLRLDALTETLSGKEYSFDYFDDHTMPHRISKDSDYWGLYNGKKNTSYVQLYTYYDTNNVLRVSDGANRDPVLDYAKTGALKKIHLPTGGSQEFEYELDDYKFNAIENQFYEREHTAAVTSSLFNNGYTLNVPLNIIGGPDYRDGFAYKLEFYWANNPLDENDLQDLPTGSYCHVELLDQNNNLIQRLYHNIEVDLSELSQNKSYTLRFHRNNFTVPGSASLWAKLTWYQNNPKYVANKKAGNLRVKTITLKDYNQSVALKRNYKYRFPNDTLFSSAEFRDFPKSYITESPGFDGSNYDYTCSYINYSNNYDVNTSTFKGKSVVYEYVTEEYVNPNDTSKNYYTQNQFSLPVIQGYPQPSSLPKTPFVDNSFTGGLLLNKQAINSNGDKVSETTNQYVFDNHFNGDSYNNHFNGNPPSGVGSNAVSGGLVVSLIAYGVTVGDASTLYNYNYFFYPSTWVKLQESTTKTYFGNNVVEQKVTYGYDDNSTTTSLFRHIKPISQTTHSSSGDEERTVYTYPQELSGEPHVPDLIAANRIASPLVTLSQEKIGGSWQNLSKQKTIYEDWGNNILQPEVIQTAKDTEILKDRIEFHDYDDHGNPLELSKADGMHVIYVWGYNTTKPIAKIENATYTGMSSALTNVINAAKTASNNDTDNCRTTNCKEQLLRNALETLRNRSEFSNAMVSTYTYDPLVGVTSMTDPKGYTMYYEYDDSGRLLRVLDQQGKVISENAYHYKQ